MRQPQTAKNKSAPPTPTPSDRLETARDLMARLTLSRTTLWRMRRDHEFPRAIKLTPTRIAWKRSEVDAWIERRSSAS